MREFATQLVRDLAARLGSEPFETLDGLGILVALCHFATLIPVCGAFVPNRLGLAAWIRLWPYIRRPMLIYAVIEGVLIAATALILLCDIPPPAEKDPKYEERHFQDRSTRNTAPILPYQMALMGLALPGMFMVIMVVGLVSGQPQRRLRANLDRAGATHQMDALVASLTTNHGWKLIRHWHPGSQSQVWWLGQSMPLTSHTTTETQMAAGHLLASPRRSLFFRLMQSPQGAILEADLRILDIVLADTKVREDNWIDSQVAPLEKAMGALGLTTLRT
jgi:hypothetical protein